MDVKKELLGVLKIGNEFYVAYDEDGRLAEKVEEMDLLKMLNGGQYIAVFWKAKETLGYFKGKNHQFRAPESFACVHTLCMMCRDGDEIGEFKDVDAASAYFWGDTTLPKTDLERAAQVLELFDPNEVRGFSAAYSHRMTEIRSEINRYRMNQK